MFAATYPSRTRALVALEGYARTTVDESYKIGLSEEESRGMAEAFIAMWGSGNMQRALNPDMPWNEEIRAGWAKQERLAASPKTVRAMMPLVTQMDVADVLPAIRVPTLVLHHVEDQIIRVGGGRF